MDGGPIFLHTRYLQSLSLSWKHRSGQGALQGTSGEPIRYKRYYSPIILDKLK